VLLNKKARHGLIESLRSVTYFLRLLIKDWGAIIVAANEVAFWKNEVSRTSPESWFSRYIDEDDRVLLAFWTCWTNGRPFIYFSACKSTILFNAYPKEVSII